jgi:outer membrane protein insertion porin family
MQNAKRSRFLRSFVILHFAFCILHYTAPSSPAQPAPQGGASEFVGQPIVEIVLEQEGQRLNDPLLQELLATRVGQPLSIADVRDSFDHLFSLGRFDDIQPTAEAAPGGVRLRYVLVPSHPVDRVEFRGILGMAEGEVRRILTDRYGRTPPESRAEQAARTLQAEYRDRGYPAATVKHRVEQSHNPDRATLIFDIDAGRRARIAEVQFRYRDPAEAAAMIELPVVRQGEPYDRDKVDEALRRWEDRMKAQGYYQASASHGASMPDDAIVSVTVTRGPLVMLAFSGDPLPDKERDRLVPLRTEGSVDEDLLEDGKLAIERYLHERGYRDAVADYKSDDSVPGQLKIDFHVTSGPRYTVDTVRILGNEAYSTAELEKILTVKRGDRFVRSTLEAQSATVADAYRMRGFFGVKVMPAEGLLPSEGTDAGDRRVEIILEIDEGPRTSVRTLTFAGNTATTAAQLHELVPFAVGAPFVAADVLSGRDRIANRYWNRGYLDATVKEDIRLAEDDTRADISYTIDEGQQTIVDHIIVTGNDKTKPETILEELEFKQGEPLGLAAITNSQAKLARLGLFRRINIQQVPHRGEATRDVLVQVVEADRTTIGYTFGLEATLIARPTGPNGAAEDHLDVAPRGGFEIGRRNLWGSNRSVNLFTRVSLRSTESVRDDSGQVLEPGQTQKDTGFKEFRVLGTFREPRLTERSELVITGIVEQALRTTFNFSRRIARVEVGTRLTPIFSVTGRYSFEKTKLFDQILTPDQNPILIDKLFPQVRLSKIAGSLIRETRDDLLDPTRGASVIFDADLSARALGSEVGFIRTFTQGFFYRQLTTRRRLVLALGGRLGAARGFETIRDQVTVNELPASERFFAGGDTTVRGFSLDRAADERTMSENGFPVGGNGVIIVNAEMRGKLLGPIQGVGFIDAGNVFPFASDLSLTDLRTAAGFGVRVNSPLGPIRLDLGFNLDRKVFAGVRERSPVLHISIGQAF